MKKYCVIGSPISHSLSPLMHNTWFDKYKLDSNYERLQIDPSMLPEKIQYLKNTYEGFNVTYPLKSSIIPFLDYISPRAERIGSVNTVKISDGKLEGYNTDVMAMDQIIKENYKDEYYILGNGNMARTVIEAIPREKTITVVCRDIEKGKKNIKHCNATFINFHDFKGENFVDKCIINTLPRDVAINELLHGKNQNIFINCNYGTGNTLNMEKYMDGLELLILQGIESFFIWTGIRPNYDDVVALLNKK